MSLTKRDLTQLHRIISTAQDLLARHADAKSNGMNGKSHAQSAKRVRRTGNELVRFRKMLQAQRRKGVSVAELAREHGVSSAYIYMLP